MSVCMAMCCDCYSNITHLDKNVKKNVLRKRNKKTRRCDIHNILKRSHLKLKRLGTCPKLYLIMVRDILIWVGRTKLESKRGIS